MHCYFRAVIARYCFGEEPYTDAKRREKWN